MEATLKYMEDYQVAEAKKEVLNILEVIINTSHQRYNTKQGMTAVLQSAKTSTFFG